MKGTKLFQVQGTVRGLLGVNPLPHGLLQLHGVLVLGPGHLVGLDNRGLRGFSLIHKESFQELLLLFLTSSTRQEKEETADTSPSLGRQARAGSSAVPVQPGLLSSSLFGLHCCGLPRPAA